MGHRLRNTNNQVPEAIDDAPPPPGEVVEDLYDVPPEYQQKPPVNAKSTSERKIQNQPQSFPPAEISQEIPPWQDQEMPQQFPPSQPSHEYENPNSNSAVQFPPQQPFPQPTATTGVPPNGRPMMPMPLIDPGVLRQQLYTQGWKSGLFDCMDDPENALITACFPCVTFGQIAEILDNGNTSCATSGMFYTCVALLAFPCIMSCTYRTKMRAQFRLIESPAPDWMVHFFCEWCALCQEYRELKQRNIDPSIGWLGNLAVQQQMQHNAIAVPTQQMMM